MCSIFGIHRRLKSMSTPSANSIVPIEPVQTGRRRMNLSLRKFDMSQIKDDKVVVFIGKRDTG